MIKELMHDPIFLAGKSEIATKEDLPIAQDLLDTLMAHKETCVGMAANMIGVKKRIIAFLDESGRAPVFFAHWCLFITLNKQLSNLTLFPRMSSINAFVCN